MVTDVDGNGWSTDISLLLYFYCEELIDKHLASSGCFLLLLSTNLKDELASWVALFCAVFDYFDQARVVLQVLYLLDNRS